MRITLGFGGIAWQSYVAGFRKETKESRTMP
jgi:hypothetical protein